MSEPSHHQLVNDSYLVAFANLVLSEVNLVALTEAKASLVQLDLVRHQPSLLDAKMVSGLEL